MDCWSFSTCNYHGIPNVDFAIAALSPVTKRYTALPGTMGHRNMPRPMTKIYPCSAGIKSHLFHKWRECIEQRIGGQPQSRHAKDPKVDVGSLGMKYELWATQLKIMSSIMSGCSIQRWFGNQSNKRVSFITITQPFKVTSSKLKSTCCTSLRLKLQEQHLTRKRKHTWPAAGWTQGCRVAESRHVPCTVLNARSHNTRMCYTMLNRKAKSQKSETRTRGYIYILYFILHCSYSYNIYTYIRINENHVWSWNWGLYVVMDLVSTLDSETYKYVSDPSRATSSLLLSDFNTVLAPISVTTDMSQTLLLAEAVILRIGHCKERACR